MESTTFIRPERGSELHLDVEALAYGGNGIARLQATDDGRGGYVVFVAGAIPGDRVRAVVTKRKRGYADREYREQEEMMSEQGHNQHKLEVIHPSPDEAYKMPYAPAVSIVGACDLMFVSGCTPSNLYHHHPHRDEEHIHPHSIEEQTTRAMECIKLILDEVGASFKDVVKITKYLTDMRDADGMNMAMKPYMGQLASGEHDGVHQSTEHSGRTRRDRRDCRGTEEELRPFATTMLDATAIAELRRDKVV